MDQQNLLFGLNYGALAGIPVATGNLNPSSGDIESSGFGLGDVLLTPVSLYGGGAAHDYQVQLTLWSSSRHFAPGSSRNRGAGYWSLVYSLGGAWYPGGDRRNWSVSAIGRYGQNFEQAETGIEPGDDLVIDWGVGKVIRASANPLEVGISGFATWQITEQAGS